MNRAAESLIVDNYGEPTWERVKAAAGIEIEEFLSQELYDDAVTFRLVSAASQVTGLPADVLLQALGEYWILYTGQHGYGALLDMTGGTLPEFLKNLDGLHARVDAAMPYARLPRFRLRQIDQHSLWLEYHSERRGLAPMVIGLVKGLGPRFGLAISVEHTVAWGASSDHDEFLVRYQPR